MQSSDCGHITKVFFVLFLVENLTVFNEKERRIALISCIVMWLYAFLRTPYYSSVGLYIVYLLKGFVRTFYQINENQPHTFFL